MMKKEDFQKQLLLESCGQTMSNFTGLWDDERGAIGIHRHRL